MSGEDGQDEPPSSSLPSTGTPVAMSQVDSTTESSGQQEMTIRKSTRNRAHPKSEEDAAYKASPTSTPTQRRKLQPVRGNWTADHLLTNSKSKLATVSLPELLSSERAWTELSRDEQLYLVSLLPGASLPDLPPEEPLPNVPRQYLRTNSSFMSDVRLFQEDLAAGRYEPVWLRDAQDAMEKRARGDFDSWKEKSREEFWGQKQKVDWNALSGESSQHSLATLVEAGYIEVGDIWSFRMAHMNKETKENVLVEKEAKVSGIARDYSLSFTFPPAAHKFSSPANGEDILVTSIETPQTLLSAINQEDGRLVGIRRANAWKDFRCIRKNQDMGSLWDIRELYQVRQSRQ